MATITVNVNASFSGLSDTPNSYTGQAGKFVVVKGTEDGVEFQTLNADNLFTDDLTLAANRTHDLNGNSVTFLKSNFEFRAADGLSTGRAVGLRNHTNTSYYLEARNNGTLIHIGNIVQTNDTGSQSFLTNVTSNFTTGFEARITGVGGNGVVVQRLGGAASVGLNITGNRGGFGIATFGMLSQYNVDGSVYSYDTDTYTQYAADRGGVAGKSSVHFRCEDGTVNVIGDLSGFGTATPTSRLEAQALNGNSGERVLGLRNHTNTGWLAEFRNDGQTYFGGNIYVPNIYGMYLASNSGTPSAIRTSFGALFIEAFSTLTVYAENKPLISSINNYPALVYSAISLETPDVTLWNGSLSFYIDEVNNDIKIKVKKSDGTIFTKTI